MRIENPFPLIPFPFQPIFLLCIKTPLPENPLSCTLIMGWKSCLNTNRKEVKCRSEKPLPSVFFISFVVIFGSVVVFGHQESVGKLKKNKFPDISYQSSPRTGYKICPIFFYKKKHKMLFGNLIIICKEMLCFSA